MVGNGKKPQDVGYDKILYPRIPFPFFHVENDGRIAPKEKKNGKINHKLPVHWELKAPSRKQRIGAKKI